MRKGSISVSETPSLIKQWDNNSNTKIGINPDITSVGSQKKAFWYCEKHKRTYSQIIRDRNKNKLGCDLCKEEIKKNITRDRYLKGKPTLAETNPELVEEWISCSNPKFTPQTCLAGSNVSVKWKCKKCGGEYDALISNRAMRKSGCPYCAGKKVLVGYNDLQTCNPELAKEWSSINTKSPSQITPKSNEKVYWVCKLGHKDYLSTPKLRSNGQGCPECAKNTQTSFPEQAIFYYVRQLFADAVNRYDSDGFEIDIFIPSINTGIEYNGVFYHHSKKDYDQKKRKSVEAKGVRLITVVETDKRHIEKQDSKDYYYISGNYDFTSLSDLIINLLKDLSPSKDVNIDCEKDRISIYEQYINSIKNNSVAAIIPEAAEEWDYVNNGRIKPEYVSYGSSQKYHWICKICGFSYMARPKERARGNSCPCCAGKVLVKGVNDLATKFPNLAEEWDYEKNGNTIPEQVTPGSSFKAWWKCSNGHSWKVTINNRSSNNTGCPFCSGRYVISGENDLATKRPDLLEEWDYEKNKFPPQHYKEFSNTEVYWKCKKKHSYKKQIASRASGRGCPYCANRKVWKGFNDLQTHNPELAAEWDFEKNKNIKPDEVLYGSHRVVWWKCPECGNSWETKIVSRASHTGCPKCHHKYWKST